MFPLFLTLFILVCLVLIIVVLLQSSKGGSLAGAFGGGGGGSDSSVLGGRGAATFLSRMTVYLASAFMVLSFILAILSSRVQTTGGDEGIIARRQQTGTLDVFNVNEESSLIGDIQTEGFVPESQEAVTDEAIIDPAAGEESEGGLDPTGTDG